MKQSRAARDVTLVVALIVGLLVVLGLLLVVPFGGNERVMALGTSMSPTIENFDILRVDPQAYAVQGPQRGDVVILKHTEDQPMRNAKRVIGLPGETVTISGGFVYINGDRLDEPYLPTGTRTVSSRAEYVVPWGRYFVLGDNREVSFDSRQVGFIPLEWISGKALI